MAQIDDPTKEPGMSGSSSDKQTQGDGPPVFLPEPPSPNLRPADQGPMPELSLGTAASPGTGRRLDPNQLETRRGLPRWLIWAGLVAMVALSVGEGSPFPILIGFAAFFLLRRRARR